MQGKTGRNEGSCGIGMSSGMLLSEVLLDIKLIRGYR